MLESILAAALITVVIVVLFAMGWLGLRTFMYAVDRLEFAYSWKDNVVGYSILIAMLFLLSLITIMGAKSVPTLHQPPAIVTAEAE